MEPTSDSQLSAAAEHDFYMPEEVHQPKPLTQTKLNDITQAVNHSKPSAPTTEFSSSRE